MVDDFAELQAEADAASEARLAGIRGSHEAATDELLPRRLMSSIKP